MFNLKTKFGLSGRSAEFIRSDTKPIPSEASESSQVIDPKAFDQAVISWPAPEYIHFERGRGWYLVASSLVGLLVLYALITKAWTMALVFLVLAGVYYWSHQKKPQIVTMKISELGIKVGNRTYPYHQMAAFWLIYKPPRVTTLNFQISNGLIRDIVVPLGDQDPTPVRNYLLRQIPEWEGKDESLGDVLVHLLRL